MKSLIYREKSSIKYDKNELGKIFARFFFIFVVVRVFLTSLYKSSTKLLRITHIYKYGKIILKYSQTLLNKFVQ